MDDLLKICKDMSNDLQELKRALVKLLDNPLNPLSKEWLRTDQVIQILGINMRSLYRLTKTKILPSTKLKGVIYIKKSDVEKILNENYIKDRRWKIEDRRQKTGVGSQKMEDRRPLPDAGGRSSPE